MDEKKLWNLLYDAAHDDERAATFASQTTVAAFGHQWAEIPSGKYMLSDPIFRDEVDDIISKQELLLDKKWFAGKSVLDAGCGGGRWSYGFSKLGCALTFADTNSSAIEATKAAVSEFNSSPRYVQTSLETIDQKLDSNSFDLVWCWGVAHHCTSFSSALRALAALVKPGGLIHMYLYGRESIGYDDDVKLFMERMRYNFSDTEKERDAFLVEKMAGHGLDRHHVHDIYAPLINRRFYFKEIEHMLGELGFTHFEQPIQHGEVWITAVKGPDDGLIRNYRLPKHPAPYWFQRPD